MAPDDSSEASSDIGEFWLGRGGPDDEFVHVIVRRVKRFDAVEFQKHGGGEPSESLVAVDEGVVVDDRLQERRSLGEQVEANSIGSFIRGAVEGPRCACR